MKEQLNKNQYVLYCNWCGKPTTIIWVHGHGQCALCGINIDECCRGEQCELPVKYEPVNQKTNEQ